MSAQRLRWIAFWLTALAALGLVLTGCGTTPATVTVPRIVIKATDYAFDAPAQVNAGLISVRLENDGQELHHAQLARLQDGKTMDDLQAAFAQGEQAAIALLEFVGGPSVLDPGKSQEVVLDLKAGNYVILCFVPSADGVPHLAKGMVRPLQVVAANGQAGAQAPQAVRSVVLKDFGFEMPAEVKAGQQTWEIKNAGPQLHEIVIFQLAPGKTMADVGAFLQSPAGPPPFEAIGGMQALSVGKSAWLVLDLQPGNYVVLCNVPDSASGKAHAELGMIMPFTAK
ncbi:MAG TPA: hypothetical protein VNK89_02545 [Thermoflexus sp.]|nr:hypothetical protein [Thermoflexus sp.]